MAVTPSAPKPIEARQDRLRRSCPQGDDSPASQDHGRLWRVVRSLETFAQPNPDSRLCTQPGGSAYHGHTIYCVQALFWPAHAPTNSGAGSALSGRSMKQNRGALRRHRFFCSSSHGQPLHCSPISVPLFCIGIDLDTEGFSEPYLPGIHPARTASPPRRTK